MFTNVEREKRPPLADLAKKKSHAKTLSTAKAAKKKKESHTHVSPQATPLGDLGGTPRLCVKNFCERSEPMSEANAICAHLWHLWLKKGRRPIAEGLPE